MVRKKLVNSFFFYGTIYLGDSMKKKLLILFLFLSMFMIVGCGKKKEEVKEKPKDEIRELKETEIEELTNRIDAFYYFDINPAKSFKTSELTNQEVLLWASFKEYVDGTDFSKYETYAKEYLDFSLEPEDILCMTHSNILGTSDYLYKYDVNTKKYIENKEHVKHSETGYYAYVYNKYLSSQFKNGEYIITFGKLFSDTDVVYSNNVDYTIKRNWYKSYSDAKAKKNPVITNYNNTKAEEYLKTLDEKDLVKYTYTFKIKDGNYVLKSYEIEQ